MRSAALLLLLLVLLPVPAQALQEEDLPVRVTADVFRYDRRTRVLTASGHVVLTADDVTIRADDLVANLATGEVNAEGQVSLEVAGQTVAGDFLTYNINTRVGTLYQAETTYTGPMVLGSVTLRAARLEGDPPRFASASDAFATTCDPDDPLVSFTAAEIGIIVGDKIVGRRVSVWLGDRRLFTLPWFIIFLQERRESRIVPVVGYSDAEGWFLKTAYTYYLTPSHYGFFHADWMERLGVGVGVEHVYQVRGGRGSALLYRLANRQTGGVDLRGVLAHAQQITPSVQASVFADYFGRSFAAQPSTSSLFTAFDLSRQRPEAFTFLFGTYSQSSTVPGATDSFLTTTLAHSQRIADRWFVDAYLPFTRVRSALGVDDELMPRIALAYLAPGFSARLVTETRWDLDAERFPGDSRYALERLPELTAALAPIRLGETSLVAQLEGGAGRFRETTVGAGVTTLDAVRTDLLATVTGPVRIGERGTLGVRAFARGSWYSTGDRRVFSGGRIEYVHRLTERLDARAGYTGQFPSGTSPFVFDQIAGTVSSGDVTVSYRAPRLLLSAGASYDFLTRTPGLVTARAFYLPPGGWSVGAAVTYDPNLRRLDRVEANVDLQLGKEWRAQYIGYYDGLTGRVVHDRVSVSRIFCDCLGVSLTHFGARNETWLEVWLTAVPWGRGRVGIAGRGGLLFDQPLQIGTGR
ncbi:MAG TPA: LptA/OstA family protein [bacterium]|nr:LptA/OstA family protein [bacterium]